MSTKSPFDYDHDAVVDPWLQASETFAAAANFYAQAMEAWMTIGAGAMMGATAVASPGSDTSDKRTASSEAAARFSAPKIPEAGGSWYRPPVQNPFLEMIDDAMKPWRTFVPDHSASARACGQPNLLAPHGAADLMAAYQSATGFSMAQVSFPDEKSICVTMPAPWAFLSGR